MYTNQNLQNNIEDLQQNAATRNKPFRLNRLDIFLTYARPNTDINIEPIDSQQLLEFISDLYRTKLKYIVVSREYHQQPPGEQVTQLQLEHFHIYARFTTKIDVKNAAHFDFKNRHPNIQAPRNVDYVIQYVKKCGDFVEWGQHLTKEEKIQQKNQQKTEIIRQKGLKTCLDQGIIAYNQLALFDKSVAIDRRLQAEDKFALREDLPSDLKINLLHSPNSQNGVGLYELCLQLDIDNKKTHWFIYGESNTGKTTASNNLFRKYKCSRGSTKNNWIDYKHEQTQLIIFDEFDCSIEAQQLNAITDRIAYLNIKGSGYQLDPDTDQYFVIIFSNFSPDEYFKKHNMNNTEINAFYNRFYTHYCD